MNRTAASPRIRPRPFARLTRSTLAVAASALGAANAWPQPPAQPAPVTAARQAREPLNSERIEQKFGSYGVAVLENGAETRVASLFSTDGNVRTCRTFAVSRYPAKVDAAFAVEHAEIVAGGSIGAVFAAHGWTVRKTHLYFGEAQAWPALAGLMHVAPATTLAEDIYVLEIVKGAAVFEYATIAEIHHPDYLRSADLPALYGRADSHGREQLVRTMIAFAAARAAR
jgi:hypothetical protein